MDNKPEYVSVRAISERFGWHKSTTHRLLTAKKIRGKKVGRSTMVNVASVEAYVKNLPDR
jgi:excisionase family DNA binding protein